MDDFDYLNHVLNRMYWDEVPDPNNSKSTIKVNKCDPSNFDQTPEFNEIISRYPGYEDEFRYLITTYFGNTFMNIPSQILGYYCNLDAYFTLMIRKQLKDDYTDTCVNVYMDNLRLGARLHMGGMYKDQEYLDRYQFQCDTLEAYGLTYAATAYTKLKLDYLRDFIPNLDAYNESLKALMKHNELCNGDPVKIAKTILQNNLSELYDSGLDEGTIYDKYGEDIYNALIEGLKDTNTKAEASMLRKKKVFVPIADRLTKALSLDHLSLTGGVKGDKSRVTNLERYFRIKTNMDLITSYVRCEASYESMKDVWTNQMTDIYHIPLKFRFLGTNYDVKEYVKKMKDYFPCTSPKEYGPILEFLVDKYLPQSAFLSMIYNNLNKVEILKIFNEMYGDDAHRVKIEVAFDHFMKNLRSYPPELINIVRGYLADRYGERMTDTFDDARG